MSDSIEQIDAIDAFDYLSDEPENYCILDVRNIDELEKAKLNSPYIHIPLSELADPSSLQKLEPHRDQTIICLCHHGMRSLRAAGFLLEQGFKAVSLSGGIHACRLIDKSIPSY
jgi:rhodanese-related sulfurtransferase